MKHERVAGPKHQHLPNPNSQVHSGPIALLTGRLTGLGNVFHLLDGQTLLRGGGTSGRARPGARLGTSRSSASAVRAARASDLDFVSHVAAQFRIIARKLVGHPGVVGERVTASAALQATLDFIAGSRRTAGL